MRQSWIRVSALIAQDDKVSSLPSDSARFAWIVALGMGKFTDKPGTWQSEAHFKASLHGRARFLEAFVAAGLMGRSSDGALRILKWDKWQSDPTATERKERWKNAHGTE